MPASARLRYVAGPQKRNQKTLPLQADFIYAVFLTVSLTASDRMKSRVVIKFVIFGTMLTKEILAGRVSI